jgi:hypothetical protein
LTPGRLAAQFFTMEEKPRVTGRGREEAARRQERLAEALRENLKKRKEQARDRRGREKDEDPGAA